LTYVNVLKDGIAAIQNNWFIVSSLDKVTSKPNETKTPIT
jgi:hypothetical protein